MGGLLLPKMLSTARGTDYDSEDEPLVRPMKKQRAKPHFTRRNAKKLHPTIDILEVIATKFLYKDPVMLLQLMMTNKELYYRVLNTHSVWKNYYRKWEMMLGNGTGSLGLGRKEMVLPNLFGVPIKVDVRPSRNSGWFVDGIPQDDILPFNKFVKKLVVMEHNPMCSACGTLRMKLHPVWMANQKLCKYCLADNLISDQVLAQKYGLKLDTEVNEYMHQGTWEEEDMDHPMIFSGAVQDKVYYFSLQVPLVFLRVFMFCI